VEPVGPDLGIIFHFKQTSLSRTFSVAVSSAEISFRNTVSFPCEILSLVLLCSPGLSAL
jgi:hypothetical protein